MNLIDVTGEGGCYLNLAHVRLLEVKRYGGQRIGLTVIFSDGEQDAFLVPIERFYVLEDVLRDMIVA